MEMEMEMETMNNPHLPHEVIIQILLRLPVKSLICFKCVCKLWFSLISNPQFAKSHFQLLSPTTTTRRILSIIRTPIDFQSFIASSSSSSPNFNFPPSKSSVTLRIVSIDFESDIASSVSPNFNFQLPEFCDDMFTELSDDIEIRGSCRGFILLTCSFEIYLWNPSTGIHKQIPLFIHQGFEDALEYSSRFFYSFGYDESKDDYLVISVLHFHVAIFSLRANEWEKIVVNTHFPLITSFFSGNYSISESLFNGAIHWLARAIQVRFVVAFDLVERNLLEIPLPEDVNYFYESGSTFDLWEFKECLSIWVSRNNTIDIWVMKEYKVGSSWTKTFVLPIHDDIPTFAPICCTKSGDIIGTTIDRDVLMRYNDKGEFLKQVNFYSKRTIKNHLGMYTESLLSLPSDNEQA